MYERNVRAILKKTAAGFLIALAIFPSFPRAEAATVYEAVLSLQSDDPSLPSGVSNPKGNFGFILANLFWRSSDSGFNFGKIGKIKPQYLDGIGTFTQTESGTYLTDSVANVGFGTALPTARIHVIGKQDAEGLRIVSSNYSPLVVRNSDNSADFFRVTEAWNVGIGMSAPSYALDVGGDFRFSGTLQGGTVPAARVSGLGTLAAKSAVSSADITDGTVATADVANSAVTDAKIAPGISPSKLAQASAANGQVLKWNGTAWAPAADSTGIGSESDPAWTAASGNYYTKTNLQTSGQAAVHPGNISWGTAGISITGNADTVDSLHASQFMRSDAGNTVWWGNLFGSNKGASSYVGSNSSYGLQAFSSDYGAAGMSFHRGGAYAVNMGLDPDNVLRIGGWSAAANRWQLDMSGNETLAGSSFAQSFVDSNNSGYYLDPNNTSQLNHLHSNWLNTPSWDMGDWGNGVSKYYVSNDDYVRYVTRNSAKVQLGLTGKWDADRRDYTTDSNYFVGSMGWWTTDLNSVFDWGSGFWDSWSSPANSPGDTSHYVGVNALHYTNGATRYGWQMAGGPTSRPWFRNVWGGSFGGWQRILTDSNDPYAYNMNQYVRTSDSPTFAGVNVSGTVTSGKLRVVDVATEGTGCSPNGTIASDSTGLLLSCQSGTWKKQGGGSGLGDGQTWQNVTASRAIEVTYTNTTGKPIAVSFTIDGATWGYPAGIIINDVTVRGSLSYFSTGEVFAIVPNGATYRATNYGGGGYIIQWNELR